MRLHEDSDVFKELIEATADRIGLPEIYIEKDYWVTQSLQHLAFSPYAENVVFKGGTSLSKAHKLIARFSEDIDLAVLPNHSSDSAKKKLLKDIEAIVTDGLMPLPGDERESKGSKFRRTVHQYPRLIDGNNFGQASSDLLIELNSFTYPAPSSKHHLQSLIAEALTIEEKCDLITKYELQNFPINVLSVERILIEKMLCVIKDSYSTDPLRMLTAHIRHLYDIDAILRQENYQQFINSSKFPELIAKCVNDEKDSGFGASECLNLPLAEAPLFTNFNAWRESLNQVYNAEFANFVYEQLPPIDSIEASLILLRERLM